jgi:2-hydroxy-6-oxonona-2,4-dienedioate hydrolase
LQKLLDSWLSVNGLRIYTRSSVREFANRPCLIFVHGLGVSGEYLLPTAQRLATDHDVLVPDLPGFGKSDKPPQALDVPELADHLIAWMAALGVPRAAFLANSLGCQVVVDLALRYPEWVDRAILVGPTVDRVDHTMPRQLWRGVRTLWREPWALWPILLRDYLDTGTRRLYRTFRYALDDPIAEKFCHVAQPTLVVRGSRDLIVPQRWAEEVAAQLPRGRLAVIAGGTHAANFSPPDQLAELTRNFLSP